MSTSIGGEGKGGIPSEGLPPQVEVSYLKYNKQTKAWEGFTPSAKEGQIWGAKVASIVSNAQRAAEGGSDEGIAQMLKPGSVSQITAEGIFEQDQEGGWKQILAGQDPLLGEIAIQVRVPAQAESLKQAIQGERAFLQQVKVARGAFQDANFVKALINAGWSQADIDAHLNNLLLLEASSEKLAAGLEAGPPLGTLISTTFPDYVKASAALVLFQKVGNNWPVPIQSGQHSLAQAVSIDLTHGLKLTSTLAPYLESADVEKMTAEQKVLESALKVSRMVIGLNLESRTHRSSTERLGAFVKAYQSSPDLFNAIMIQHGMSDRRAQYLFSHYPRLYESMAKWSEGLDGVVALANQGKLVEALSAYTKLIDDEFSNRVASGIWGAITSPELGSPECQSGLRAFTERARLSKEILSSLDVQRVFSSPIMPFEATLAAAAKEGVAIPQECSTALARMKEAVKGGNAKVGQAADLLTEMPKIPEGHPRRASVIGYIDSFRTITRPLWEMRQLAENAKDSKEKAKFEGDMRTYLREQAPKLAELRNNVLALAPDPNLASGLKILMNQLQFISTCEGGKVAREKVARDETDLPGAESVGTGPAVINPKRGDVIDLIRRFEVICDPLRAKKKDLDSAENPLMKAGFQRALDRMLEPKRAELTALMADYERLTQANLAGLDSELNTLKRQVQLILDCGWKRTAG